MTVFRSKRAIFAKPIFYLAAMTSAWQYLVKGLVGLLVWWLSFPVLIRHGFGKQIEPAEFQIDRLQV
jgi:hypothetical protein